MKKKDLAKLVEMVIKETEEEMKEMWFSTNDEEQQHEYASGFEEAGLTSEIKEKLKNEIRRYIQDLLNEGPEEWTHRLDNALKELNATLRLYDDPDFEQILLKIQDDFGLSDYETYLVGENSRYPTTPETWREIANGRFYKYAVKEEPFEREY